jgi:hypothetical protein
MLLGAGISGYLDAQLLFHENGRSKVRPVRLLLHPHAMRCSLLYLCNLVGGVGSLSVWLI